MTSGAGGSATLCAQRTGTRAPPSARRSICTWVSLAAASQAPDRESPVDGWPRVDSDRHSSAPPLLAGNESPLPGAWPTIFSDMAHDEGGLLLYAGASPYMCLDLSTSAPLCWVRGARAAVTRAACCCTHTLLRLGCLCPRCRQLHACRVQRPHGVCLRHVTWLAAGNNCCDSERGAPAPCRRAPLLRRVHASWQFISDERRASIPSEAAAAVHATCKYCLTPRKHAPATCKHCLKSRLGCQLVPACRMCAGQCMRRARHRGRVFPTEHQPEWQT